MKSLNLKTKVIFSVLAIAIVSLAAVTIFMSQRAAGQKDTLRGAVIKSADYEAWRLECVRDPKGGTGCRIFQRLVTKGDKPRFLLGVSMMLAVPKKQGDGKAMPVLRFSTPAGVHLPTGIIANIDKGQQFNMPFQSCGAARCFAQGVVDNAIMKKLQAGATMAVGFRAGGPKPLIVEVSLKGFPDALKALQAETAALLSVKG